MVDGLLFAGFRLRQSDSQLKPPPPSISRLNSPVHQIRAYLFYCLLGLLSVSGMRLGEARNLELQDVDLTTGVLTIRGALQIR